MLDDEIVTTPALQPTDAQHQAIAARGNVLVSASAGTGKTSTLVARCLELLVNERCSLTEILMVTFTDAAAAEMRYRIQEALRRKLSEREQIQENSGEVAMSFKAAGRTRHSVSAAPSREEDRTRARCAEDCAPYRSVPGKGSFDLISHLEEQLALLDTAHIGTLHSFCLHLVRQHFHELGIDPQVTVLDEHQTQPLIQRTLDDLLQKHYAARTTGVLELIRHQGRGSDDPIRVLVLTLHRYTQSLANPARWFTAQKDLFRQTEPAKWRVWFDEFFKGWRDEWLPRLGPSSATPAVELCLNALKALPASPSFAQAGVALAAILHADDPKNWPHGSKKNVRQPIAQFFDDAEFLQSLTPMERTSDPLAEDWAWVRPHMLALVELAREFTAEFSRAKRDLGGVDFADLEQFALQLLRDPSTGELTPLACQWQQRLRYVFVDEYQDINGAQDAILTALSRANEQANRFLVGDVKQSIYRFRLANPKIFRDYEEAWRTDPAIGTRIPLADNFRSHEGILQFVNALFSTLMRPALGGVAYDADAVLRFGDPEGRAPLSVSAGHAARAAGHELNPPVELHLITKSEPEAESGENGDVPANLEVLDLATIEREARLVALRLRELRNQKHLVWDPEAKQFRPVQWRDMAVLLRSPAEKAEAFAKQFSHVGVPLSAARGGFYDSTEISDLLSLLQLLDNPLQDVPLLAVLRSPLVGLSLDELAKIRASSDERLFWTALRQFHRGAGTSEKPLVSSSTEAVGPVIDERKISPRRAVKERSQSASGQSHFAFWDESGGEHHELTSSRASTVVTPASDTAAHGPRSNSSFSSTAWPKVDAFLRQFDRWRALIQQGSLSQCLEAVLAETYYEALLQAEPRGEARAANVRLLLDLARQYDPYQRQGLYRFLQFVDAQQEAEVDLEPAAGRSEDAVRLMSIHKSKGLEFPVVVVAWLGGQFNFRDLHGDILLHEKYGLCPRVIPPEASQSYPSLPFWLARQDERREWLGEELRLLYVAMTRARDTLILTGTAPGKKEIDWFESEPASLEDRGIAGARSFLDWLRLWLPHATKGVEWSGKREGRAELLRWTIYSENDARLDVVGQPDAAAETASTNEPLDEATLQKLRERIAWQYPFAAATAAAAKRSVTALARSQAEAEEEAAPWLQFRVPGSEFRIATRGKQPPGRLSAVEIGMAHHRFLQCVSLDVVENIAALEKEAQRMCQEKLLAPAEIEALDLAAVAQFWQSELGQKVRAHASNMQREVPFTLRLARSDLADDPLVTSIPDGEYVVLQGVIDLAVLLPHEIWLVDFKTDDLKRAELEERRKFYAPQLKLYALALEKILRRPVTECWLHFLSLRESVSV